MNVKNLWVGNVYNCAYADEAGLFIIEPGEKVVGCILEKVGDSSYKALSNGIIYTTKDNFGANKVDENSIKPLSKYYNTLGFRIQKKGIINSEVVHENVKKLRKARKI